MKSAFDSRGGGCYDGRSLRLTSKGVRNTQYASYNPHPALTMTLSLNRDGWLILLARSVRALAYGFLSVRIGLYLAALGYDTAAIGLFLTVALAGSAALTLVLTSVADRWGRRRVLLL